MAREYKEQSTEYLRGQNANPIVSGPGSALKTNAQSITDQRSPVCLRRATKAREWFTRDCNQEDDRVESSVGDLLRVCWYETWKIHHTLDLTRPRTSMLKFKALTAVMTILYSHGSIMCTDSMACSFSFQSRYRGLQHGIVRWL